jgi:hypothetical protein
MTEQQGPGLSREQADLVAYRAALASYHHLVACHIAQALVFGDDAEHERARALATALDGAGLNVDGTVDDIVPGYCFDPSSAWTPPSVRRERAAAEPAPF